MDGSLRDSDRSRTLVDPTLDLRAERMIRDLEALGERLQTTRARLEFIDSVRAARRDSILADSTAGGWARAEQAALEAIALARGTNNRIDSLRQTLAGIEAALSDDAERALTIPMLRRDIEDVVEAHETESLAMERQLDRIIGQNRWMVSILFTLSVALLAAVFRGPMAQRQPEPAAPARDDPGGAKPG
jgi:hypothetical protein